jgi:hypothetical protein
LCFFSLDVAAKTFLLSCAPPPPPPPVHFSHSPSLLFFHSLLGASMTPPLRRLPEALAALVFSALELREHGAFRRCDRFFDAIARHPTASPRLLRLLVVPPPPFSAPTSVTTHGDKNVERPGR